LPWRSPHHQAAPKPVLRFEALDPDVLNIFCVRSRVHGDGNEREDEREPGDQNDEVSRTQWQPPTGSIAASIVWLLTHGHTFTDTIAEELFQEPCGQRPPFTCEPAGPSRSMNDHRCDRFGKCNGMLDPSQPTAAPQLPGLTRRQLIMVAGNEKVAVSRPKGAQ